MNNFAGSLTVFEDSRVFLLDLLKLIWSCLDYLTCYATINYWREKPYWLQYYETISCFFFILNRKKIKQESLVVLINLESFV